MIYLFDSYYRNGSVNTACVGIADWKSEQVKFQQKVLSEVTSEYVSGQFYKRELPGILQLLENVKLENDDIIVIDGYVYLDDDKTKGLGGYLYEALDGFIPVIGVAKNRYKSVGEQCIELLRGQSKKPLYITAAGMDVVKASENILSMSGDFRIPNMLKLIDAVSREEI